MRLRSIPLPAMSLALCGMILAGLSAIVPPARGAETAPTGQALEVFRGRSDSLEDYLTSEYTADETGQIIRRKPLSHPYLESGYDGSRNLPLAACAGKPLTEQDLLLYRLMRREPVADLFDMWEKTRRPSEREELTGDLEDAVQALAYAMTLADIAPAGPFRLEDEKFIRFLKYPVYQLVWIQKVLKPAIRLEMVDLIKYYHDNIADFYKPESVRVRYVFFEVASDAAVSERERIENEARAARAKIASGADFVELARARSDAPSAIRGGELPPVHRGMFFEDFENQAFGLNPSQVSPVFRGPGGFYIVQCLEKTAEEQTSFTAVQPKLYEAVERKVLTFQYDYQLNRMAMKNRRALRAWRFRDLGPDDPLIELGLYRLTKGEFLDVFPQVIRETVDLDYRMLAETSRDILRGELIAQIVEEKGFASDPLLQAADQMARRIRRAQLILRKRLAVPLNLTEPALRKFYEENRDALGVQPLWRVFQFDAAVRNPYLRHPTQMTALSADLREHFQQTLDDFLMAFREERARAAEERVLAGQTISTAPLSVALIPEDAASTHAARIRRWMMTLPRSLSIVTGASTNDYLYTAKDLGYRSFRDRKILDAIQNLRDGQFSAVEELPGGIAVYFVERYMTGLPADYTTMNVHIRQQYIVSQQAEALDRLRIEIERKAALQIQLPEIGSPRE